MDTMELKKGRAYIGGGERQRRGFYCFVIIKIFFWQVILVNLRL